MPQRFGMTGRRRSAWGIVAAVGIVVACSGKDKAYFNAPPIAHGGAGSGGKSGAGGAKAGRGGTGGAGATVGKAGGPVVGDAGDAPDATGGAGEAGVPAAGGTGGTGVQGGTGATGGTPTTGGSGGAELGGTTALGGSAGVEAGGSAGTAGSSGTGTGGGGASAGTNGGLGGSAGLGGAGATAGLGGAGAGMGGAPSCVPTVPPDEICDGIDNDCQDGIDGPGVCPDGCVAAIYDDHRYLLCSGVGSYTYTRTEAHDACVTHGDDLGTTLDLVRINSAEENSFVLGLINDHGITDSVWNGASDSSMASVDSTEGTWVWGSADNGVTFYRDGSPVSNRYNDWAPGQPDDDAPGAGEDCAVFDPSKSWHWDDVSCSVETSSFVCEEPTR